MVSFISWSLYPHGTHWIEGNVGPTFSLDTWRRISLLSIPGIEPLFLGRSARSLIITRTDIIIPRSILHRPSFGLRCCEVSLWPIRFYVNWYNLTILQVVQNPSDKYRLLFPNSRRPVRRADNLTTFMCPLSWNLGASTSWNPQGLSRLVMGLLYLSTSVLIRVFGWMGYVNKTNKPTGSEENISNIKQCHVKHPVNTRRCMVYVSGNYLLSVREAGH